MEHAVTPEPRNLQPCVWPAIVSVTGLSFWFFIGFPFANHNESYAWVGTIRDVGVMGSLMPGADLSRTYRPLGQFVAVGSYWISGGSLVPIQLFNYLLAGAALAVLTCASRQPMTTAAVAALFGATFFPGFIYLFHLHGVFYSPVLLLIPLLLWLFGRGPLQSNRTDGLAAVLGFTAFLFHPYALIIFVAMYAGFLVRRVKQFNGAVITAMGTPALAILGGSLFLIALARPADYPGWSFENLRGFLATFKSTEIHWLVSGIAAALAAVATLDLFEHRRGKFYASVVLAGLSGLMVWLNLPVSFVWILACFGRSVWLAEWPLTGLLLASLLIPAISPTGSPTYGLFGLVGCVAATGLENRLVPVGYDGRVRVRSSLGLLTVIALLVVLLRLGTSVPLISRFARPLAAEREKTLQLDEIIRWWELSDYHEWPLTLFRKAQNPIDSATRLDGRVVRPPTYQSYLDVYTGQTRGDSTFDGNELLVTFGNDEIAGMPMVRSVDGQWAGQARVYLRGRGR